MKKQKVISVKELKENFCLETIKQDFLGFEPARDNLDNYLKTRKEYDFRYLVNSVMIQCDFYFKEIVCTNDMWKVDSRLSSKSSLCLEYGIYTVNNNKLRKENFIITYLQQEDGIYFLELNEYLMTAGKARKRQSDHDMEVGRFILQCYVDLLNEVLQEAEK